MSGSPTAASSPSTLFLLGLLCVAPPVLHWLALGPQVPEGTFVLLSRLHDTPVASDPSNIVYAFARPWIYDLLGWVFLYPLAFLVVGFIAHAVFNASVLVLTYQAATRASADGSRRAALVAAAAVTALIYPLSLGLNLTGHGTTLVPHDAYYHFSFRTLHDVTLVWGYLALLSRRLATAGWIAALGSYLHPTAGILALGLVSLVVVPELWRARAPRLLMSWLGALAIGTAPLLSKLVFLEAPAVLAEGLSYGEWYSQLIKDEADDFSVLAQLVIQPAQLMLVLAVIVGVMGLHARAFPANPRPPAFWHAGAMPVAYLGAAILELLFAVVLPTPFIHLLAGLSVGYRLLSFAFFPLLVLLARMTVFYVERLDFRLRRGGAGRAEPARLAERAVAWAIAASWLGFAGFGLASGHLGASLDYGRWASGRGRVEGVEAYHRALVESGEERPFQPPVYQLSAAAVTYPGERNVFRIHRRDRSQPGGTEVPSVRDHLAVAPFVRLVGLIRHELPVGSGLVIPPYLRFFRDSLPSHAIYFQEHHDGNLMMGSPAFARFWTNRMRDLLGFTYEGLPSKQSGLSFTVMRDAYLALTEPSLHALYRKHPAYRYFVTERVHRLALPVACATDEFVVYDLGSVESGPAAVIGTGVGESSEFGVPGPVGEPGEPGER